MGRNCQYTIELREIGDNIKQILRDGKGNRTDQLEKSNVFGLYCLEILRNDNNSKI